MEQLKEEIYVTKVAVKIMFESYVEGDIEHIKRIVNLLAKLADLQEELIKMYKL